MINLPDGFVLLQNHNGKPLYAACFDGGRFHGWLMSKHPDGQWVSSRKLESWEVMQAADQRDDKIIHETGSTTSAKQASYDVVFKAIAAATCVAGNAVSVSVAQFYTALLASGYTIRAADALDSQPGTDEPTDREALIACLGDDAVTLLRANPDDEMAQTMREAAAMLENDGKALDSQPTEYSKELYKKLDQVYCSQPTDGGVRNGQLMRFYAVETVQGLIDAQEQHIAKLQAKLPRDTQPAFTRVREG